MATANSSSTTDIPAVKTGNPALSLVMTLLVGTLFGIVLTKSEVARWQRVHDMFLFREAHMYLIIGVGIFVAMICMLIIRNLGVKDIQGEPIVYRPKRFHKGTMIGGTIFGMGWAIAGACPGPIYAQIGAGSWWALFTLAGALLGTYIYAMVKPALPH